MWVTITSLGWFIILDMAYLFIKLKTLHFVTKNVTTLACCNFNIRQPILLIFGRNVAKEVSSQTVLYFPTSPN